MRPVVRRVLVQGALTAALLAAVGFGLVELGSAWLASAGTGRARPGSAAVVAGADGETFATLRTRVPLMMAAWGFVFVAVGEVVLRLWRGEPRPAAKPIPPQPDEAEKLLEELLRQAEDVRDQRPGDRGQETGQATTPEPTRVP